MIIVIVVWLSKKFAIQKCFSKAVKMVFFYLMNGKRGREKHEVRSNSKTNFSLCWHMMHICYHFPVNIFNKARLDVNFISA